MRASENRGIVAGCVLLGLLLLPIGVFAIWEELKLSEHAINAEAVVEQVIEVRCGRGNRKLSGCFKITARHQEHTITFSGSAGHRPGEVLPIHYLPGEVDRARMGHVSRSPFLAVLAPYGLFFIGMTGFGLWLLWWAIMGRKRGKSNRPVAHI